MIIVFVVIGLLGGGAWWYLSGELSDAQSAASTASGNYHTYATKGYFPTPTNQKTLTNNTDALGSQLDPVVKTIFQSPDSKLTSVKGSNPVDWKHALDTTVADLNSQAKLHGVQVPATFYYGFSRYQGVQPTDEATTVLSKQLLAVQQIAGLLINAPVKAIRSVKRTYSEDPAPADSSNAIRTDSPDLLPGSALDAPGGIYTAYPFEIDFDVTTEGLHSFIEGVMKSPYVFVIRSLTIQNSNPNSPRVTDLDKIAGTNNQPSIIDTPGATAAAQSTAAPQFLFGSEYLHVLVRIDLIEWHGIASGAPAPTTGGHRHHWAHP